MYAKYGLYQLKLMNTNLFFNCCSTTTPTTIHVSTSSITTTGTTIAATGTVPVTGVSIGVALGVAESHTHTQ